MWKKKLYIENNLTPFTINRSKIDLFFDCNRCFYLDQKHGIKRPHGTPLALNNKVVQKLKSELEICRKEKKTHPQVLEKNLNFIPISNHNLEIWKNPFKGITYHHKGSNFLLNGTIDDIWVNNTTKKNYSLIIKSSSKQNQLSYEEIWSGYWRQLSFYSYLLEKNHLEMSKTGVIVFINTLNEENNFSNNFSFKLSIFEKILDFSWIESTIKNIFELLNGEKIPEKSNYCKYCNYYFNIKNRINE